MPTSSHIQLSTSTIICHHLPTNISKATFLVDSHRPPGPRCCWTSRARSGRGRGARGARGRGRSPCRCASRGAPSLAWWPSQRLPGAMGGMAEGNWREMEGNSGKFKWDDISPYQSYLRILTFWVSVSMPQMTAVSSSLLSSVIWARCSSRVHPSIHRTAGRHLDLQLDDPVWISDIYIYLIHTSLGISALQHQSQLDHPSVEHDLPLLLLDPVSV